MESHRSREGLSFIILNRDPDPRRDKNFSNIGNLNFKTADASKISPTERKILKYGWMKQQNKNFKQMKKKSAQNKFSVLISDLTKRAFCEKMNWWEQEYFLSLETAPFCQLSWW